jgi:hypothetical protein
MSAFVTYDSSEVCELVGIGPLLLNKFIERKSYGIQPSIRPGKGRGGRRLFSPDDVLGIALVWWLFESGLRSGVIEDVLDGICAPAKGIAAEAAKKLRKRSIQILQLHFIPKRLDPRLKLPWLRVEQLTEYKPDIGGGPIKMSVQIGHLYMNLVEKMQKLTGLPEGT